MRKIKKKSKTRRPLIIPRFAENVEIGRFDLQDGIFSFYSSTGGKVVPLQVEIGESYTRKTGNIKIINSIQVDSTRIDLNANNALASFDWLFAIDTNTRDHNGSRISVSSSVLAVFKRNEPTSIPNWEADVVLQDAFIFRNAKENPEIIGWQELTDRIRRAPTFKSSMKIGIIVDSEQRKISSINAGKLPVLGNHNLPENFRLIYATSDTGVENAPNKLLRICDRTSSFLLDVVSANGIIGCLQPMENPFMDGSIVLKSAFVSELVGGGKNWQG